MIKKIPNMNYNNKILWFLFIIWSILTLFLITIHAFWLDEVVNLIIGIGADPQYGIHGNGHPAVWFLLLRLLFLLFHRSWILPLASFLVASTAVWLFLFKSPFKLYFKILFLCSNFAVYEYVIMARNYGISMLFMFLLAIISSNTKLKNKMTGPCLFVLCNTNIHSSIISFSYSFGQIILFFLKKKYKDISEKKQVIRNFLYTLFGIIICAFTVLPTFDNTAKRDINDVLDYRNITHTLSLAHMFNEITFESYMKHFATSRVSIVKDIYDNLKNKNDSTLLIDDTKCLHEYLNNNLSSICQIDHKIEKQAYRWYKIRKLSIKVFSFLLFLSLFSLWREVDLFISALTSLFGLSAFFAFFYPGGYRHQALWLVFMITLLWIKKERNKNIPYQKNILSRIGLIVLIFTISIQIYPAFNNIKSELYGKPNANSKILRDFIRENPSYKNSIFISNDDFLLEPVHYYMRNPTYVMTQDKFSIFFPFSRNEKTSFSLGRMLDSAKYLSYCNKTPVLILLAKSYRYQNRIDPEKIVKPTLFHFEYINVYVSPEDISLLKSMTKKIFTIQEANHEPGYNIYSLVPENIQLHSPCPSRFLLPKTNFSLDGK